MKTAEEQDLRQLWRAVRASAGGISRGRLLEIVGEPDYASFEERIFERYPAMRDQLLRRGRDVGELDGRDQDG